MLSGILPDWALVAICIGLIVLSFVAEYFIQKHEINKFKFR